MLFSRSRSLIAGIFFVICLLLLHTRFSSFLTFRDVPNGTTYHDPSPPAGLHDLHDDNRPIPIIIFAFNRAENLRLTLDSVLASASFSPSLHPIFISQDGEDAAVAEIIASYGQRLHHLHFHWIGIPGRTTITPYLKIAEHYQFALTEVMDRVVGHERWDRVIMLEDDMYVAPDFFSYFRRVSPLFDIDPSLYCASAWNENGQGQFVSSSTAVYRTDSFPGLGWMWSRALWEEFRPWTRGWWDDWLREDTQRKGRSCVYPEISRAYTFGREGVSRGFFFDRWFKDIRLNVEDVDWDAVDLDYLPLPQYDEWWLDRVQAAERMDGLENARRAIDRELEMGAEGSEKLLEYKSLTDLTDLMKGIGLMYDHKAGVPRTSYKGVLQFRHRGVRIWIALEE